MRQGGRSATSTAILAAVLALFGVSVAYAQAPGGETKPPVPLYQPFVFIEIEEHHRDQAGEEGESAGTRMPFPYAFDSRRGILRPTPDVQGQDFLQRNQVIVLHRMDYDGQRRHGSYWTLHRFGDLPLTIDLPAVPEQSGLALSADEKNRFVRPVSLSWLKKEGGQPCLHVEYGSESADLAGGQAWTSRPSWFPTVFANLKRPVNASSEVSVRFGGLVRYCPYAKEEEEAQLLLDRFAKGSSPERTSAAHELVSIADMAIAGLVGMIENQKPEVRQQALDCLAVLCARQAVPEILRLLDSPNWGVAESAAYTLGWLGDARAVEALLKVLKGSDNDALVAEAAGVLGAIGDERAVPALKGLLSDASPKRALAAAQGLGHMGIRDGLSLALQALEGEDKVASSDSLSALWIIGGKEAHEALLNFGRNHEKEPMGKQALLFATLVAARDSAVDQRRQVLQNVLAQKGIDRLLAAYEIERLQTEEALTIYRTQIERFECEGDFESSANLRLLLLRCMARKAWKEVAP